MRGIVETNVFFKLKEKTFCDERGTLTREKDRSIGATIMLARGGVRSSLPEMKKKRRTGKVYTIMIFVRDRVNK